MGLLGRWWREVNRSYLSTDRVKPAEGVPSNKQLTGFLDTMMLLPVGLVYVVMF